MGLRYTVRRVGAGANFAGVIFGMFLLVLCALVAVRLGAYHPCKPFGRSPNKLTSIWPPDQTSLLQHQYDHRTKQAYINMATGPNKLTPTPI